MNRERENLKAGLFVTGGVILVMAVVFVLADFNRFLEQKQTVKVYFQLMDGLQGLKTGASVTLGDQSIGDVVAIQDKIEADQQGAMHVVGKVVEARIPKRYDLYQNALIELKAPLIGSGTALNIRSVGQGERYTADQTLVGSIAGTPQVQELVREAGIQEQQRQQIRNVIASFDAIATTLRQEVPQMTQAVQALLADAQVAAYNLKQVVADAQTVVGGAKDRYTLWLDRIDRLTDSADQSFAAIHDLVRDKEKSLRVAIDNLHHVTEVAKEKTMVQVAQTLDKASEALANLKLTTQQLQTFVVGQRPVLERTLANTRLASDQLKLAAIEVRRSPWRLLYEPDDKELDTDNLYDAARSFALAAGVLDSTTQSLQALAVEGAVADQEQFRKMLDHLEAVFAKFQNTETVFWDAIAKHSKGL